MRDFDLMGMIAGTIAVGGTDSTLVSSPRMARMLIRVPGLMRLHFAGKSSAQRAGESQTHLDKHRLGAMLHPFLILP